jgi:hypothetical protein
MVVRIVNSRRAIPNYMYLDSKMETAGGVDDDDEEEVEVAKLRHICYTS